jgi:ribonuclease Z
MSPRFQPRLVNGPFDDPALYVSLAFEKRAILFDLGDLGPLPSRDILKISHCFISHTHMDHFCGFDRLLRLCLGREKRLHLYGPEGFLDNLEGKLRAYNWNLVDHYRYPFELIASEITTPRIRTRRYACRAQFIPETGMDQIQPFEGVLLQEPSLRVEARILDHGIPCLGFSLAEPVHINIDKVALDQLALATGPWLKTFKLALYSQHDPNTMIEAPTLHPPVGRRCFRLGDLADGITRTSPGHKIGYITDVAGHIDNQNKIIELIHSADHLFIESAFRTRDHHLATSKYHLTAGQAGEIAAQAGVKRYTLFHFSPRYCDEAETIREEAKRAFMSCSHPKLQKNDAKQNLMHP